MGVEVLWVVFNGDEGDFWHRFVLGQCPTTTFPSSLIHIFVTFLADFISVLEAVSFTGTYLKQKEWEPSGRSRSKKCSRTYCVGGFT